MTPSKIKVKVFFILKTLLQKRCAILKKKHLIFKTLLQIESPVCVP